MKPKKIIFRGFLTALVFYFSVTVLAFATVSNRLGPWLWTVGGIVLANLFTKNVLNFLAMKSKPLTNFIATFLLTLVAVYFLDLTVPGFEVAAGRVGSLNLGFAIINGFTVNEFVAKIVLSTIFASILTLMNYLGGSGKSSEEE